MKCPKCNEEFYTLIEEEPEYEDCYLCLNCMTVFNEEGEIIEEG